MVVIVANNLQNFEFKGANGGNSTRLLKFEQNTAKVH